MKLNELKIKGFKSIDSQNEQHIHFGDRTVLLGANGAGKSNLISFFRLMSHLAKSALQPHIARQGSNQLLFYGAKKTEALSFSMQWQENDTTYRYDVSLAYGLPDRLFFRDEELVIQTNGKKEKKQTFEKGHAESSLASDSRKASKAVAAWLRSIQSYQFHDTSDTSRIKDRIYIDDASALRDDAGNLAAFLAMLKKSDPYKRYYERITRHIRKIMPQFQDFSLEPLPYQDRYLRLNWTDNTRPDYLFGPDQISDGSLRFMALATLLLQPPELLPRMIVLDEPELGLHPAAIVELAGMIKRASHYTQIILATQSTRLIDEFSPEDILIVERARSSGASSFRRLNTEQIEEWLERYTLADLWEKNVIGGQP